MAKLSRRGFLRSVAVSPLVAGGAGVPLRASAPRPTDIRILEVSLDYEDHIYRAPYKFRGTEVDRVTILNVRCAVETVAARRANGFGSMTMGNVWSFPSPKLTYAETLAAMKQLAERIRKITAGFGEPAHPVEINYRLEPEYLKAAADVSKTLAEPIPKLCTLVTASAFDAALHDAYGKAHDVSSYRALGADFEDFDLARYLRPEFRGEHLDRYVRKDPAPRLGVFHSIGASDPIVEKDLKKRIDDGLPETLPEWIRRDGLSHLKLKLDGRDLAWDVERVLVIDRVAAEAAPGVAWQYSLDFNERCPNVDYLLEFCARLKEGSPRGFERILYIEQPTARDLKADRANVMHRAAKLKPVVIDESLTDLESLLLARQLGYTGVALKACKGISQSLQMAAAAQKYKMFLCVQDLTCPGASFIENLGLAARVPGVTALEANAREYVPLANQPWKKKFPEVFVVKDGTVETDHLTGPGLNVAPLKEFRAPAP